jgi:hypothetical protein
MRADGEELMCSARMVYQNAEGYGVHGSEKAVV